MEIKFSFGNSTQMNLGNENILMEDFGERDTQKYSQNLNLPLHKMNRYPLDIEAQSMIKYTYIVNASW